MLNISSENSSLYDDWNNIESGVQTESHRQCIGNMIGILAEGSNKAEDGDHKLVFWLSELLYYFSNIADCVYNKF